MNLRNCLIFGLALVLASTLTVSLPAGRAQAQRNSPGYSNNTAGQNYTGGYRGYNGYGYCPRTPRNGFSAYAIPDNWQSTPRSWNSGYQGAGRSWNSGNTRGSRGGWGCR